MKKSKNKILAIILVVIFILNFSLPVLVETSVVLAAAATDYDFRNELNADRVGIGFTWTAETRTLTITGIKNSSAEIKLPENSTIDIQGNIENEIKKIESDGSLTIKGNNVASLNIDRIILDSESSRGIWTPDTLTIDSGIINIKITINYNRDRYTINTGIWAKNIIINNGNINIDVKRKEDAIVKAYALYAQKLTINNGKVNAKSTDEAISLGSSSVKPITVINGGDVRIESASGYAVTGYAIINGGNVYALTTGDRPGWAYENVPSINPLVDWTIFRGYIKSDGTYEEQPTDITDIYTACHYELLRILSDVPAIKITEVTGENEIGIGEKTTFVATLEPSYSTSAVTWSSSNEKVATVSENGEITGIGTGVATIIATANGLSASKDINVKCKITLDPNGVEGIEKEFIYTDVDGKLQELPTLSDNTNLFNKWVDENGNEVTTETKFTTNTTIYADWTAKPILVGTQKDVATYGKETIVNYDVTSDFDGTYTAKVENLPEGVTLVNNEIKFDNNENGKYKGTLKLKVSNTANAGTITNLKMYINNKNTSNNFSLEIKKIDSTFTQEPELKVVVFNGEEQELIKAGSTNDGQILYSLDGVNFSEKLPTATKVGKYKVYYRIVGDKNHLDSEINSVESTITDLLGDVNGDGKVNARDAKLVLQYFNGKVEFTEEQKAKADVNGDSKINARDAKLILQIFNGK